jgi:haloacetate dehalogenase
MFAGFVEESRRADRLELFVRHAGSGPAVVFLHGHPRTSSTWYRVAPALVSAGYTVVCPDLLGYGRSEQPAPTADHAAHSKRASAGEIAALMSGLGHDRFSVVGHDRGSYVGLRLCLDHPDRVESATLIDCIPISEHLARADAEFAAAWWHWFFYAQPDIPERVINADPDAWYAGTAEHLGADNYAEFRAATRQPAVVRGMLEDYRAGLGVDRAHELADRAAGRRLAMPVQVLWSTLDDLEDLHGHPLDIWADWADDLRGHGIRSTHHMAEDNPDDLVAALLGFLPAATPATGC